MSSNFKCYLFYLSLFIGVGMTPSVSISHALISSVGSDSIEERITQLERVSNAHSQVLNQLQHQIAENQGDIDLFRGRIQENQYQLSQLVESQKGIYPKIDPSRDEGLVITGNHLSKPVGIGGFSKVNIGRDPNIDYNAALALVLDKKQYDQAISAFQSFIERYPNSEYQANANYWLGQLHYKKNKKEEAAYYFSFVVKNYPKSLKAPDALLKIGIIMQEKGEKDKAKAVYQKIGKLYPSAKVAKQAQKRLANL